MTATVHQLYPVKLLGSWTTPPTCKGEVFEVQYGTDGRFLFRRIVDTTGRAETFYHRVSLKECSKRDFEPWKREPNVPPDSWQWCSGQQAGDT